MLERSEIATLVRPAWFSVGRCSEHLEDPLDADQRNQQVIILWPRRTASVAISGDESMGNAAIEVVVSCAERPDGVRQVPGEPVDLRFFPVDQTDDSVARD